MFVEVYEIDITSIIDHHDHCKHQLLKCVKTMKTHGVEVNKMHRYCEALKKTKS